MFENNTKEKYLHGLTVQQWIKKINDLLNNPNITELNKKKLMSVLKTLQVRGYFSPSQAGMVLKVESRRNISLFELSDEDWKKIFRKTFVKYHSVIIYWDKVYENNKNCTFANFVELYRAEKDKKDFIIPKGMFEAIINFHISKEVYKNYNSQFKYNTDNLVKIIKEQKSRKFFETSLHKQVLDKRALIFETKKVIDPYKYGTQTNIYKVLPTGNVKMYEVPECFLKKLG